MFGHDDNPGDENNSVDAIAAEASVNQPQGGLPSIPPPINTPGPAQTNHPEPAVTDQPWTGSDNPQEQPKDVISPVGGYPKLPSQKVHVTPPSMNNNQGSSDSDKNDDDILDLSNSDLAALKIQALDELYPLIDQLDLSPDEKFRTLMMMIQASDNQELVQAAYDAAHNIKDDKDRAKALLDIVNEINYFTQQPGV